MKELSIIEHLESLEQFKISCSQIGKIIGEGKAKSYKDKILAQKALIQETENKFSEIGIILFCFNALINPIVVDKSKFKFNSFAAVA